MTRFNNTQTMYTRATIVLLLLIMLVIATPWLTSIPSAAAQSDLSPEEQLVRRYAPHLVLRQQAHACDPDGEPYMPLPIEAVLNDSRVMLRENAGNQDASFDPIVAYGPTLDDIAGLSEDYYLDFPGNPLDPACFYEQWSREKEADYPATTYARIVTLDDEVTAQQRLATPGADADEDVDKPADPLLLLNQPEPIEGLAIQYWFFYLFNDFNNKHEGDWEMIQLNFEVDSVEDALNTTPSYITAAQHGGGERTAWDANDVTVQGSNPLVYSAAGSHATHFDDKLFIGWGKNGTGFGCDDTRQPGHTIQPEVVLIPADYATDPAFAWLTFSGRWGEKQNWEFNGPRGPQFGKKWNQPVTWVSTVRENSLYIPDTTGLGPMPGKFFCGLAGIGSNMLIQFTLYPWWTAGALALVVGVAAWLFTVIRRSLVKATRVYFRYRGSLASIAVVLIPLGFVVTVVQQALTATPPLRWVIDLIGTSETSRLAASLAVGELLALIEAIVIAPAVIATMEQIRNNQRTDAPTAWRSVRNRFLEILAAWISIALRVFALAITVIGLPWALRNMVRWAFFAQAVMIDDAHEPAGIRAQSASAVKGSWLSVAAHWIILSLLTVLPGPIIGVLLLVFFSSGIEFVNVLSSVVYAYVVPFKAIALTMLYYRHTGRSDEFLMAFRQPDAAPAAVEEPLGEGASAGD